MNSELLLGPIVVKFLITVGVGRENPFSSLALAAALPLEAVRATRHSGMQRSERVDCPVTAWCGFWDDPNAVPMSA